MTAATNLPAEPLEERFAEVRGVRVRSLVGGEGPPLVLVHGLGGCAENWAPLAPLLAPSHRLLVIDLPGHGRSAPLAGLEGLAELAEIVAEVAAAEGMPRAAYFGHSLGGVVALRLALRRPEAVTKLVLAAPAGISSSLPLARLIVRATMRVQPGRLVAPFRHRLASRSWYRTALFRGVFVSDAAALSEGAVVGFLEGPPHHVDPRSAARALGLDDPRAELGAVQAPVLLLWGARDRQLPLTDAFDYARRLRARLRVVADCGHLVIGERPDACADAVLDFLP
jgi:pimeloyl-ACP methyl ester carboxylesterase